MSLRPLFAAALGAVLLIIAGVAQAAPAFQAAGTAVNGTGNVSPAWPTHEAGDVALLFVESRGGEAANLGTAAGFTLIGQSNTGGTTGTRLTVYWARATSNAMGAPTVTDPGDHVHAQIITYRGVIGTGNPYDVHAGGVKATASAAVLVTGVTTTVADTLVVQSVSRPNDATGAAFSAVTNAGLTSIGERADGGTNSNDGGGFVVWDGVKAAAGTTGDTSATINVSVVNAFYTIALIPATTYYSRASASWATGSTWSTVGCGGSNRNVVPPAGSDVVVCAGNTVTLNTDTASLGSLTTQATGILSIGNNNVARTLTVTGSVTNGGTIQPDTGSNTTHAFLIGGNLVNNGTFDMASDANSFATVTFNGGSAQTVSGSSAASEFQNMTLNNANGLTLSGTQDVQVNATLTLTAGRITTGANVVYIASGNAVASAGAAAFVVGNLRKAYAANATQTRVFEVGTEAGGARYAPVSVTLVVPAAGGGDFTVSTTAGDHPNIATSSISPTRSINRYWTLTNDSVTITSSVTNSVAFNYVAADYDAGIAFASFYVGRYSGSAWTEIMPASPSATTTTLSGAVVTTVDITGDYQIGERPPVTLSAATLLCGSTTQVEVLFSKAVTAASAQNAANYSLSGGATVSAAVLDSAGQVVTLTTSALTPGQNYTLTVSNVVGTDGTTLAAGSQASFFTEGGYRSGLLGTYFTGMTLSGAGTQRVDGQLNFDWVNAAPGVAGIGADNFSVRWTGYVTPSVSGSYTFRTTSDDGVRLRIDNVLMIDNWTDHAATNNFSAAMPLIAGQRYQVSMEFYENGGQAVAQLAWSGPATGGYQFIPRANLSHFCGLPSPVAFYKLDEASWSGAGTVTDSSGNGLHGSALGGAVPASARVCLGAQLNGSSGYVEIPDNPLLDMAASFTVAAWIRPAAVGPDALKTIVSKDENYEFHLTSAGQINWWWNNASSGIEQITTTGTPIAAGAWTHVAIVYAPGAQTVYINGVSRGTAAFSNGLLTTADPLQIGSDQGTGGRFFNGLIDEVRIYASALAPADIATIIADTRACAAVFDHLRIEHDGLALTCAPETVTLRACADAACSSTYAGSVTATLSPTGWVGGDTVSFSGGSAAAQLRRTTAGAVALGGSTVPAPINATRCFVGGTETCALDFRTAGFIFDVPNLTACRTSASVTMTAVRADNTSQACVPAFESGTRTVNFWSTYSSPATGTLPVQVNGGAVSGTAPGTGVNLSFGPGATTSFTVRYQDAGQMLLNARYTGSGDESGLVMDGSDQFVSVPVGISVATTSSCAAGDSTCAAFATAGASFPLAVKAACWTADGDTDLSDNPPTPNFQMASIPLTHSLIAPSGGATGSLGAATATLGPSDAGETSVSQSLSEVGVFRVTATPAANGYFGLTVPGGTSANIGRIRPDHFVLDGTATLTTRSASTCTPASSFTYMGEPFSVAFTLAARNAGGAVTQNYTTASGFAKLDPATIAQLGFSARDGATLLAPPRLDLGLGSTGSFTAGSAAVTAVLGLTRLSAPDGPFAAQIGIRPVDGDGVTITGPDFDGDAVAGNERKNLGVTAQLRFGRLRLQGAAGSGIANLGVPIQTQYWNGSAFVRNTDDSCTALARSSITLSSYRLNLNACETAVIQPSVSFSNGTGQLTLAGSGAGNNGSVLLSVNLGAASGQYCPAKGGTEATAVSAARSYLQGAWTGAAWDQDPSARVGFGIYGAQPRNFIFYRENY